MAPVRQSSFGGGEFAPDLWGRTDVARYAVGLRRARNFYVTRLGSLQNRGGTEYCGPVGDHEQPHRLLPFIYSDETSYVLELRPGYIGVWFNGARVQVKQPVGSPFPFLPLFIAAPYTAEELAGVRYVQSGDVLTLVHPSHPPMELRRNGHTQWTLEAISFDRPAPWFDGVEPAALGSSLNTVGEAERFPREWVYKLTTLWQLQDGTVVESAPYTVTQQVNYEGSTTRNLSPLPGTWVVDAQSPVELEWRNYGLVSAPFWRVLSWRVYRGRGALFGLVGETRRPYFNDQGDEPDYGSPPPQGRNPFDVHTYDASDNATLVRTEVPRTVAYHDERLFLGGTAERPATVWGSRVADYHNFDDHLPSTDDEGVEYTLAARKREEVRWLLSKGALLVGTSASVWSLSGAEGGPLAATSLASARVESAAGCAPIDPLVVGNAVLFVRDKGGGVRELVYEDGARSHVTADVGLYSPHLFEGNPITEWCQVEDPHPQVWALRKDGTLLCLTYVPEQELVAWTTHDTDGVVESLTAVSEGGRDVVYMVVRRTIDTVERRYVERLTPHVASAAGGMFLDCARVQEGDEFFPVVTEVEGLAHLFGRTVTMVADGQVLGDFEVPFEGVLPVPLEGGAQRVVVGLPYVSEVETLDLYNPKQDVSGRQKSVASVVVEVVASRGLYAGESLEEPSAMSAWDFHTVEEGFGPPQLHTGKVEVVVSGRWGTGGRVALQQRLPLPLTVAAIVREVVFGG